MGKEAWKTSVLLLSTALGTLAGPAMCLTTVKTAKNYKTFPDFKERPA